MSPYLLIPFGVDAICVLAIFAVKGSLMGMLGKSDPATLDRFGGPLLFNWGLHHYLMSLKAPPGTRLADRLFAYRFWFYLHICVWLSFAVMLVAFNR